MSDKDNISEDDELWAHMTKDVTPIEKQKSLLDNAPAPKANRTKTKPTPKPRNSAPARPAPPQTTTPRPTGQDIDARTNDRLRKGQLPIESRIDLHGLNQTQAHIALTRFIHNAHARGQRCILIITGKGQKNRDPLAPATGILKTKTAEWLRDAPLNALILKTHPAKPKDGGNGALYVLLRRQR